MKAPLFLCALLLVSIQVAASDEFAEALVLAQKASESPAEESYHFASEAYELLEGAEQATAADRAVCAQLAARAALALDREVDAVAWFHRASVLATARAEFADFFLKKGSLAEAEKALGKAENHPQWHQTHSKILLAEGRPKAALRANQAALDSLSEDDRANRIALLLDRAGIEVRTDDWPTARQELRKIEALLSFQNPLADTLATYASLRSSDPLLSAENRLALLRETEDKLRKNPNFAGSPTEITFNATLAKAHYQTGDSAEAARFARAAAEALPHPHPLRCEMLSLQASITRKPELAKQASKEALSWLGARDLTESDVLLGLQRTVDPISPLVGIPELETQLIDTLWQNSHSALRRHLLIECPPLPICGTIVLYFLYSDGAPEPTEQLGALIFEDKSRRIVQLGPFDKIHRRIVACIKSAEQTVAERTGSSASFDTRLTALYKSLWEPLELETGGNVSLLVESSLQFVPWNLLRTTGKSYLCEKYDQISLLAYPTSQPPTPIVIAGQSFGVTSAPKEKDVLLQKLSALPGVSAELALLPLAKTLNPNRAEFLTALQSAPPLLHLSGHGVLLGEELAATFCLPHDLLAASQISQLDLSNTRLTTLSLCRGGLSLADTSGHWNSLSRSFLAAGSESVLAARWKVRDDLLPQFMADFYQALAETNDERTALIKVQRNWAATRDPIKVATAAAWLLESRTVAP